MIDSKHARTQILAKLNAAPAHPIPAPNTQHYYQDTPARWDWDNEAERLRHWARTMRRFKTEIHWVHSDDRSDDRRDDWCEVLRTVCVAKNIRNLWLPLRTEHGQSAQAALARTASEIHTFDFTGDLAQNKNRLFDEVDAAFTDVRAAIAHTGTLIVCPDPAQPRSMSLVPPIHIALLDTTQMFDDFFSAVQGLQWANHIPSNALLISSPSKTSDIQLTLAFGAHGPRDLVVLARLPAHLTISDVEDAA